MSFSLSPADVDPRRGGVSIEHDRDRTVVWLRGEHDASTRSELSLALADAIALDSGDLVVDLRDIEFLDASTIGVLVAARNFLAARARAFTFRSPSPVASRLLALSLLSELVETERTETPTPSAALATWVAVPATPRAGHADPPSGGTRSTSGRGLAAADPTGDRAISVGVAPEMASSDAHHGRRP